MADISRYLQAIMQAVLGEQVRGSIHDAIDIINKVSEKQIDAGTAINAGDPAGSYYDKSLYINTATDKLLRCNGTTWQEVGYIRGNGISEITGPVSSGLTDTYTIHYTDGDTVDFTVTNGKGILSVTLTNQSGLLDTYTIAYNDGNTDTFTVKNGNEWYWGTLVSGKVAAGASFTLPFAVRPGDGYLNISEDALYECTSGANAGMTSVWEYKFTITSSSTGTNDYSMLINLPSINSVQLIGNKTSAQLGLKAEADSDTWLKDSSTPPQVIEKTMAVDSTSITFSTAEMATVVANGWAVKAFFDCAIDQVPPTLKKMIAKTDGSLQINYSKVKAAQAPCKCKLRIIK